ncbi:hypothetical protein [Bacillus suaedaesalsae]|uniref:Uncharacterized protein n=1 Tax=Bacillus suaedaesalsae TaxID=2810349 RepID=A0ABS2DMX6_9BACI|nr:hypothetical protein [Bacillus suaedaesalsae]MBM6619818.1 hypothetical protein [Bacillus suaedaesalsae]
MGNLVAIDRIEQAFDEVIKSIDKIEATMESHIDIEINEHKLAQLEKIKFVESSVVRLENKTKTIPTVPSLKLAFSR